MQLVLLTPRMNWRCLRCTAHSKLPMANIPPVASTHHCKDTRFRVTHSMHTKRDPPYGESQLESGGDLLSRAVSSQVPSALKGLTSVFGMGTGDPLRHCHRKLWRLYRVRRSGVTPRGLIPSAWFTPGLVQSLVPEAFASSVSCCVLTASTCALAPLPLRWPTSVSESWVAFLLPVSGCL